jgi:glycosyltransferase involved in cell wall biosynthesis
VIRILYIISTVTGGGVERRRLSLARYLDKEKFHTKLVGTHKSGFIAEEIERNGMEIVEVGDFTGPFHWEKHKKVQQIIEDFQPHIIHGAVYEGVTMAAINGFLKRVPIVILEETSDPQNRSAKASFLLKIFSLVADKFIAISPNVAKYLTRVAGVAPQKVVTINNGVETPREVPDHEIQILKASLNIQVNDFVIGSVGRLFNDHKRFSDLVKAVSLLKKPDLKLLIVGSGPDESLIRQKAVDLGISDRVIFAGYQFDTAPYYKLMDLFCIASSREGFGLVAAESMLHSLPIVATSVGGLKDVVVDRETGYLVPPYSPSVLAEKIQVLMDSPSLREDMGKRGKTRAMNNFSAKRYVKDVESLYLEILESERIYG